jgi:hypothetical protein
MSTKRERRNDGKRLSGSNTLSLRYVNTRREVITLKGTAEVLHQQDTKTGAIFLHETILFFFRLTMRGYGSSAMALDQFWK